MKDSNTITYRYKFVFSDGKEKDFEIFLDNITLELVNKPDRTESPAWTELKYFRCSNCTVDPAKNKYCPVAVNLVEIVDFFRDYISYEKVDVIVETNDRTYLKNTLLQKGISSLIGIYMVTSGCSVLEKLKPMARFHLPFANLYESKYRFISMYLVAQYFLAKKGRKPDMNLDGLVKVYDAVRIVNESFAKRFSKLDIEDAVVNALVNLDCYACSINLAIDKNILDKLETFFIPYFK